MTGTCVLSYLYILYKIAVRNQMIVFLKFQVGGPASSPAKSLEPHLSVCVCVSLSLMVVITLVTGLLCGPTCTLSVENPPTRSKWSIKMLSVPPPRYNQKRVCMLEMTVFTPGTLLCCEQECLTKTPRTTFVRVYTPSLCHPSHKMCCSDITSVQTGFFLRSKRP